MAESRLAVTDAGFRFFLFSSPNKMAQPTYQELLDAGVHFGHLTRKWDPRMAPYIFMEKNGIHIIDLNKTLTSLEQASAAMKNICLLYTSPSPRD